MSLQINALSKSFTTRTLFKDVSFCVNPAERVALVGSNGSGKTTLMKIILGSQSPDDGTVTSPKESRVGYLPQQIFIGDSHDWGKEQEKLTLFELVTQAFDHLKEIKNRIEEIEILMGEGKISEKLQDEYDLLLLDFERKGGYNWQAKTVRLLNGFGFPESRFHDLLSTFSGGWQMRAYFARLLLSEPDYLLLDEPTNYLDIASIGFLEDYLANYEGGILVVSHDRYFLDSLATTVVAIMPEGAKVFRGNYTQFLQAREIWAKEAQAAQERQNKEKKRVEKFIERFRYKASKASQVQSRVKQLQKIEEIEQVRAVPRLSFSFPDCETSGEIVLKAEDIQRAYGDNKVLKGLNFSITKGDRLAIVGENGAGKTTLMRILAGEDLNYSGVFEIGYRVHFGYFAQDEEISFDGEETVFERMMREAPIDEVPNIRNLLGAFLFSGDEINKKVQVLSGGEKSRLGLAKMMLKPCNLLMLDEPTNHLDLNSREALLNALDDFPGTIIIVSHDRFFLDSLANKVLEISAGKSTVYEGNYSFYLRAAANRKRECEDEDIQSHQPEVSTKKQNARELFKIQKQLANKVQRIKRDIQSSEELIQDYEQKIEDSEAFLANPNDDADEIAKVSLKHVQLNDMLQVEMQNWEELNILLSETENELERLK